MTATAASERLDEEGIPTLIFGGRSRLPHATALVIAFGRGDRTAHLRWLRTIAPLITYGQHDLDHAHVVAFTGRGLRTLGLGDACLRSFPTAFQSGMTSPGRSRALGDVGVNDPSNWDWGSNDHPCDAILIVYAATGDMLDDLTLARRKELADVADGGARVIGLTPLDRGQVQEPFGFTDGVSQPVLRGTRRAHHSRHQGHEVAAGEFVLGYKATSGNRKISPIVAAAADPDRILPGLPNGSAPGGPGDLAQSPREFGRNGTFLVVRQLEQNIEAFDAHLSQAARALRDQGAMPEGLSAQEQRDLVAAKMVGRWKNGSSLVRHPNRPGQSLDNDFLFGAEDPLGLACPLGAHIRRANPRDSLMPGTIDPNAVTARHRLMRVGRAYGAKAPGATRGILFMCLNADIEMQFEVVQQSWLSRRDFHGLRDETDPIVGFSKTPRRFTIPSHDGPKQLHGLETFVTVKGGAYFFMPGSAALRYLAQQCVPPS